jgi:hypothetical protein
VRAYSDPNFDNAFIDTLTLDQTGTWKVIFDPVGTLVGSVAFKAWTVPADVAVSYTVDDPAKSVATTAAGQNATVSFAATSGQRLRLVTSNTTVTGGGSVAWNIYRPDGTTVRVYYDPWRGDATADPVTIDQTGVWKVVYDPTGASTGSLTFQATLIPENLGSLTLDEAAATTSGLSAGQNGVWSIAGQAGQRIAVETTASTYTSVVWKLLAPTGATLAQGTGNGWTDAVSVPATGTYQLLIDPAGAAVGAITARAWTVGADVDAGTLTLGGAKVTAAIAVAGRGAKATFTGSVGQRVALETSGSTFTGVDWKILNPAGATVATGTGNGFVEPITLATAGTYQVLLDPTGKATGSIGLQAWSTPADLAAGALTMGTAKPIAIATPGQNATATFTGAVGQRVALQTAASSYAGLDWSLVDPTGAILAARTDNTFLDTLTLTTAGTYKILINPRGAATGTVSLTAWTAAADVAGGSLTLGTAKTLTIPGVGQNGSVTLAGTAGQRLALETTGSTFTAADWTLTTPTGTVLATGTGNAFQDVLVLPTAGTYKITVDPRTAATGKIDIKAWTVPADVNAGAITKGGAAVTITTTTAAQNGYATYNGTAGQSATFATTGGTLTSLTWRILRPDGTTLATGTGPTATTTALTLPTTGTYKFLIDPTGNTIGNVNVKVS